MKQPGQVCIAQPEKQDWQQNPEPLTGLAQHKHDHSNQQS